MMLIASGAVADPEDLCAAYLSAADAVASLIAEYCTIAKVVARKPVRVSKRDRADNLMKVAAFAALEMIPDCQELFLYAETIAKLIAENCSIAKGKR